MAAITGFTVAQLIWYLAFTEAIITSGMPERDTEVDREVRSGDVAYRLIRPLAYPLYHLGAELGERLPRFVLNLVVGAAVALVVAGPVRLVPLAVVAALVSALIAFLVDFVWRFSISLLSFWIEDTFGLHLLYRRFLMLLEGCSFPWTRIPRRWPRSCGCCRFSTWSTSRHAFSFWGTLPPGRGWCWCRSSS